MTKRDHLEKKNCQKQRTEKDWDENQGRTVTKAINHTPSQPQSERRRFLTTVMDDA